MAELSSAFDRVGLGAASRVRAHDSSAAISALLRGLGRFASLTAVEIEQVRALAPQRKRWRPGTILLGEGRGAAPHFVLSGWASAQRVLRDGRRQIFDFVVPGEGFGFAPALSRHARQSIVALTTLETVEAGPFLEEAKSALPGGLWRAVLAMVQDEEFRRLDHLVRLGRLTAYEKASHFILEMQRRAGAAEARSFALPLTQEIMADALGLSVVHLNRVLRQLRADKLVEIRGGVALIHDPKALAAAAVLPISIDEPTTPR